MLKDKVAMPTIPSGILLAALLAMVGLVSCGGGGGGSPLLSVSTQSSQVYTPLTPPATVSSIAQVDTAAASTPYLNTGATTGGTTPGTETCTNCVAYFCPTGSDTTGAGTQASPWGTIDGAMAFLGGGANRTAALCQNGTFPASTSLSYASTSCPIGSICNELREYPFGGAGAKPVIQETSPFILFSLTQGARGIRFMNIRLNGTWAEGAIYDSSLAFRLYSTAAQGIEQDVTIKNVDMYNWGQAITDQGPVNKNITIEGNHFVDVAAQGFFGGSDNLILSYNSFINVGNSNALNHSIYLNSAFGGTASQANNVSVVGNFVQGYSTLDDGTGTTNTVCTGGPIVVHNEFVGLNLSDNVVKEAANAGPGCWGISLTNTHSVPNFFRNVLIANNVVVNGGNSAINVSDCGNTYPPGGSSGCVVENNLVIQQGTSGGVAQGGVGIHAPGSLARTAGTGGLTSCAPDNPAQCNDDTNNHLTIVNNTVYYDTTASNGTKGGVYIANEGTGHIIANNTIEYLASSAGLQSVNCFNYGLSISHYSFSNNNNCYVPNMGAVGYHWDYTTGDSLATWIASTGFDNWDSGNTNINALGNPGWAAGLVVPVLDETKTAAQLFSPFFTPAGPPLAGNGVSTFGSTGVTAPATDAGNNSRANPPSIGAYE